MAPLPAAGQDFSIPGVTVDANATAEQLEAAIKAVETREGLQAETRSKVIGQLRDAQAQVQNRLSAEAAAGAYAAALETAPAETAALRQELDEDPAAAPTVESLGIEDGTPLVELEQWLAREMAELTVVEARLAELDTRVESQVDRPVLVRERINQLRKRRDELARLVDTLVPGEPQILADARKLAALLRRAAQKAEISRLEQELLSHAVRLDLLKAKRDAAARARAEMNQRTELLRTVVNQRRQAAAVFAQQEAAAAERAAADKHRVVRALAEGNASLTAELPGIAASIERETSKLDLVGSATKDIELRLARSQQRLEVGGLSRVIGRLLIEERRNLPQVSQYRAQVRARSNELAAIGLAHVQIQEQRRELTPLDSRVQELMDEVEEDITDEDELATIRSEIRLLLRDRRALLLQADNDYRSYLQVLGDLDVAQRRLLELAGEYQEFLNQNLLWIPSAPVAFTGEWRDFAPATAWAFSARSWLATAAQLGEGLRAHVGAAVLFLVFVALLIIARGPLAKSHEKMNGMVGRFSTDHIGLTLAALVIAALRALPLPLLFVAVAWFLNNAPEPSTFSAAIVQSLSVTAPFLYNLLLFRAFSASRGVLSVHFGWHQESLVVIRRQLDKLVTIGAPLVFVTALLFQSESAGDRATLGRLVFIALMVTLALVSRPLAHPETGVTANYYRRQPETWVSRLRWFWYGLAVGAPLLLALVSILGYVYTSTILTGLLVDTIWLALALIVVNLVVLRWLALARRRLAVQIARQEREAQQAEQDEDSPAESEGEAPATPLDLDEVDQQTRKLLQSALAFIAVVVGWRIWAEVLPAFTMLDQVALWTQTVMVDGVETIVPVTLANLLLALLIIAITAIASKNLPGLMEIAILQRLTLQPGSRYAANTLVRYLVVTIGAISVLNVVGWNWSQIQWLVAALSVGLGFGLQEIVANFVSGLVILFERPVRVGDTITVGQLSGTVSRVRIRATTIRDWDRKEIIVPNKSFITEQVVNWTLSDPITRIVIPVGVSYGSDVELAHKVMSETLASLPLVMDEPPPWVYFTGFGESSLDFTLHVYLRQLADRLPLTHEVHEAILKALRENGIEIPFPQHDLHIRSTVE